jgi:hypothetical protein
MANLKPAGHLDRPFYVRGEIVRLPFVERGLSLFS